MGQLKIRPIELIPDFVRELKPFQETIPEPFNNLSKQIKVEPTPGTWDQNISELETYFAGIPLPPVPVKLDSCTNIIDVSKFIESHVATITAQNGKRRYLPYLHRLQALKQMLTIANL